MKTILPLVWIPVCLALAGACLNGAENGGLATSNERSVSSNAEVSLEITAPPGRNGLHASDAVHSIVMAAATQASGELEKVMKEVEKAMAQAMEKVGDVDEARRVLEEARREVEASLAEALSQPPSSQNAAPSRSSGVVQYRGGGGGSSGGAMGMSTTGEPMWKGSGQPAPVLIGTGPLEPAVGDEWVEDLRIMDKLLRAEMESLGVKEPPRAMGIRLLFRDPSEIPPMYLEDYGAVFSYETRLALATSGKEAVRPQDRTTSSAWENARRELNTTTMDENHVKVMIHTYTTQLLNPDEPPSYDAAKLDDLIRRLARTMKEAANIRHLKKEECMVVTVAGTNDEGKPARLTLKATKADVDAFGAGQLTEETFREKVLQRIDG